MTPPEAQDVITMLLAAFPRELRPDQVEETSKIYRIMMRDLDFSAAKIAVQRLLATAKRLPTIADIREAMLEVGVGGKRSGAEAWGDVRKAVSQFGAYREPRFADPLVAEAVDAIGWHVICKSEETDPAPRAKFADAYNRLAGAARKEAAIAPGSGVPPALPSSERALPEGQSTMAELMARVVPGGRR